MTAADPGTRVALIAGGSHGVGRRIAVEFARRGTTVVLLHGPTAGEAARDAVVELRRLAPASHAIRTDVAVEAEVHAAFTQVISEHGGMDVLVNGVGHPVSGAVAELDLEELDRLHRVRIRGSFVLCREAARSMRAAGAIINLTSMPSGPITPGTAAALAGEVAVEALTKVLAEELRVRDIAVNAVTVDRGSTWAADSGHSGADPCVALVMRLADASGHRTTGQVLLPDGAGRPT